MTTPTTPLDLDAIAAVTPCACSAQRDRAQRAEAERDAAIARAEEAEAKVADAYESDGSMDTRLRTEFTNTTNHRIPSSPHSPRCRQALGRGCTICPHLLIAGCDHDSPSAPVDDREALDKALDAYADLAVETIEFQARRPDKTAIHAAIDEYAKAVQA
ncbi:hypothetical protein [Aeromicrobium sp. UC242_57]|uniref:hypothetical protein n=1 Tax=Aeromicrobium sp. UC242_57 TaxID=3374624 RepID=UPI00379E28A7